MQSILSLKHVALAALLISIAQFARAQDIGHEVPADTLTKYGVYDTDLLPPSFHAGRRAAFLDSMQAGSIAIFQSAPEQVRGNDVDYQYHQDANLYYLSGCWEPESALLLTKEPVEVGNSLVTQILFVNERDPKKETWTGKRLGPDGARSVLKIQAALPIDSLRGFVRRLLRLRKGLYIVRAHHQPDAFFSTDTSFTSPKYPDVTLMDPLPVLANMRRIKLEPELRLMRKAIAISNIAHDSAIRYARPGWHEYTIQALAEGTFLSHGAEYTAYPCIVGSGPNSTVLHYETNRRELQAGDMIEMDMGAEYHGYTADVTRSFPVARNFSPEQRAIYDLVLEAQDSGIAVCHAGARFFDAHAAAVRVITRGLFRLGIIHDSAEYKRYFMHGTSHFLGLDVHDAGNYMAPLASGVVMTVEPGIYIAEGSPCDRKWWNIGCRIEDDILITPSGPENLSSATPRSADGIEQLRNLSH